MPETDLDTPIFDVELGPDGGRLAPPDLAAFDAWLEAEADAWKWMWLDGYRERSQLNTLRSSIEHEFQRFRDISSEIADQESQLDKESRRSKVAQLSDAVESAYRGNLMYSGAPLSRAVESLGKGGEWRSVQALLNARLGKNFDPNNIDGFRGATIVVLSELGLLSTDVGRVADELTSQHAKGTGLISDLNGKISELSTLISKQESKGEERINKGVSLFSRSLRKSRREAISLWSEFRDVFESDRKFFRVELALEAPVSYWTTRRSINRRLAVALYTLFTLLLVGSAVLAYLVLGKVDWPREILSDGNVNFGYVGLVVLAAGLAVAILRIPLRLAASFLHLANDADERITMVNTYLALREGEHAGKEEMSTVIDRLFLPTQDGIVKDDLVGITIWDSIANKIRG